MELKQHHYRVLLVSSQPKFNESLMSVMNVHKHYQIEIGSSITAAKRKIVDNDYDFVIVNSPLPDDNGVRFAIDTSVNARVVLLMVKNEYYAEIFERVCSYGVYTLPKPLHRQLMYQALDWLESTHERLVRITKRSVSLEDKMKEIRLVNRAKLLLISKRGFDEDEAHHYIEKQAMDRCVTKHEIAEQIIVRYTDDN